MLKKRKRDGRTECHLTHKGWQWNEKIQKI